jgi:predicted ferric reductase
MSTPLAATGSAISWYVTRSTGAVALLLLTFTIVLGVIDVKRLNAARWPRFVIDSLHRNAALLALVFLVVHILTSVLDGFASISLSDAFVPFIGSYRPFWLGLGAIAFDLTLAVILTSLLRARIGFAAWRAVHWLTYASWPIALVHGLGTGSDATGVWLVPLSIACMVAVAAAAFARLIEGWRENIALRGTAVLGTGAFALFIALWLPSGPLGTEWARRSGTPAKLLGHTHAKVSSGGGRE